MVVGQPIIFKLKKLKAIVLHLRHLVLLIESIKKHFVTSFN